MCARIPYFWVGQAMTICNMQRQVQRQTDKGGNMAQEGQNITVDGKNAKSKMKMKMKVKEGPGEMRGISLVVIGWVNVELGGNRRGAKCRKREILVIK